MLLKLPAEDKEEKEEEEAAEEDDKEPEQREDQEGENQGRLLVAPGGKEVGVERTEICNASSFLLCFVFFPCSLTARSILYGKER